MSSLWQWFSFMIFYSFFYGLLVEIVFLWSLWFFGCPSCGNDFYDFLLQSLVILMIFMILMILNFLFIQTSWLMVAAGCRGLQAAGGGWPCKLQQHAASWRQRQLLNWNRRKLSFCVLLPSIQLQHVYNLLYVSGRFQFQLNTLLHVSSRCST